MAQIFLSYTRKDNDFAELTKLKLREKGFDVWMDQGNLHPGDDWKEIIDEEIIACKLMLVILSQESFKSPYVTYEWAFAMGKEKKIIPIMLMPGEVHPKLDELHRLDFTGKRPWDELIKEISHLLEPNQRRSKNASTIEIFSNSENQEFEFIWNSLNKTSSFGYGWFIESDDPQVLSREYAQRLIVHLPSVVALLGDMFRNEYKENFLHKVIYQDVEEFFDDSRPPDFVELKEVITDLTKRLLVCGLIEQNSLTSHRDDIEYLEYKLVLTKKYFKYRYWLEWQKRIPDRIIIEPIIEGHKDNINSAQSDASVIDLAEVVKAWRDIRSLIKPDHPGIEALLNASKPLEVRGNELLLAFQSETVRALMDNQEKIQIAQNAIKEVLNIDLSIKCVVIKHTQRKSVNNTESKPKVNTPVIELAEVEKAWRDIRNKVRSDHPGIEALLNSSRLLEIRGSKLYLGFQSETVRALMDNQEKIQIAQKAITEVLNIDLSIKCVTIKSQD